MLFLGQFYRCNAFCVTVWSHETRQKFSQDKLLQVFKTTAFTLIICNPKPGYNLNLNLLLNLKPSFHHGTKPDPATVENFTRSLINNPNLCALSMIHPSNEGPAWSTAGSLTLLMQIPDECVIFICFLHCGAALYAENVVTPPRTGC